MMTQEAFQKKLKDTQKQIGEELFCCCKTDTDACRHIYDYIEDYAMKKQLFYTALSLPLVRGIMGSCSEVAYANLNGVARFRGHYAHALEVCELLINSVLPLSPEEEDLILAAALCHIIPNVVEFDNLTCELTCRYHLDPRICEIINLIINDNDLSSEGLSLFFQNIRKNRLALLVFLADRGKLVQNLNAMTNLSANQYIYETRTYFFPMCIYAKEHYPELVPFITLFMEKVRTIVEACSILLKRYESKEIELTQEILKYKEENATIRRILKELKEEG